MLNNITIGQYVPGDSPAHRLDPRTKLALTILLVVLVFVSKGFLSYALVLGFIAAFALISKMKLRMMLKAVRPVLYIVAITFALNVFFSAGGLPIFQWGFVTVTDQGLKIASFMAVRLILLVLGTQLLTLTTSPIALTDGIESLLKPLSKIGFPAHELAMMMSIALRFIPTLMEEADKIMKAQMARGANFESGNLIRRVRAMVPLLVPLFVSAFRRADELALAMEARCYRGGAGRTRMKALKYSRLDAYAALILLLLTACVALLPF